MFDAELADGLPDGGYNVAPTDTILIVLERDRERRIEPAHWGFRPPGPSRDGRPAQLSINAKAETAAESRVFGPALRKRRCIIPVDAFYEWDQHTKPKQPYAVGTSDGSGLLALAGIWSPPREPTTCRRWPSSPRDRRAARRGSWDGSGDCPTCSAADAIWIVPTGTSFETKCRCWKGSGDVFAFLHLLRAGR